MAADQEVFSFVKDQVDSLINDAESAISQLQTYAMSYYNPAVTQVGFENNPAWDITEGERVAFAGLSDVPPDSPTLYIPPFVFNPEDYITADMLQKYSYESEFFDEFLDPRIRQYIDSQSYFLDPTVQDALFETSRERDLQALNDALDAQDRIQARRGFPVPTSMNLAARNDIIKKYQDTYADKNKEATALIAEKSLQEKMHAMDTGIKMEDIRSRFELEFGKLYWMAADYIIKQYEAEVRANIAKFQGELDLVKTETDTDIKNAGFDYEYEKLRHDQQVQRLNASIEEMRGNIDTWKTRAQMRIDAATASVEYYKSAVGSANGILNDIGYSDSTGTTPT
jgi:hypothetical protein